MIDRSFPEAPPPPFAQPEPIEIVVPRQVLGTIFQALGITIHQVINDRDRRGTVRDLFKISRRIDSEAWLRWRLQEIADEAWIRRNL